MPGACTIDGARLAQRGYMLYWLVAPLHNDCHYVHISGEIPMSYMLLIHEAVGQRATRTEAEGRALYERMLRFGDELAGEGVLLGAQSLAPSSQASRVRLESGRARIVDGPFAEAKEMIGGFFHVNVATRDEALALAARCPAAEWATVEVRALAPCYAS